MAIKKYLVSVFILIEVVVKVDFIANELLDDVDAGN